MTSNHSSQPLNADVITQAAEAIQSARALVIAAGAGMGVDSGLPDFRGSEGFWNAYPPYRRLGVDFADMANPEVFRQDPAMGWGFYGHRLNLYRSTVPHAGFSILRRWAEAKPGGCFVFTSNVDGQFQKAGFDADRVCECHGSIHRLQCFAGCSEEVWPAAGVEVEIDEQSMRAADPLPACPACGELARPNILMFGDGGWIGMLAEQQHERYQNWLRGLDPADVAVVEMGAGSAIPTVRWMSERLQAEGATLVRINPRESDGPPGTLPIASGAFAALSAIDRCMK